MVPELYDQVVERVIEAAQKISVGEAMDPDVFMGPIISAQAKQRIEGHIESGIKGGARSCIAS